MSYKKNFLFGAAKLRKKNEIRKLLLVFLQKSCTFQKKVVPLQPKMNTLI